MGPDQIASAIGGGWIGFPTDGSRGPDTGYLTCGGTTAGMFYLQTYGTQPNVLDVHLRPDVGNSLDDTTAAVQSEATIDFDDIVHYLALFPSTTTVVLGETHSNSQDGAGSATCEVTTLNAPAETVAGYNGSTLPSTLTDSGRSAVFRPWMQLQLPSGNCFSYPENQRVNFLGNGPYRAAQQ